MEKQITFNELSTRLCELIKSESYTKSTTRDMFFIINTFSTYMDENNIKWYTPKISEQLVAYCEKDLQVCALRVSRAKNIVRKLNRLFQGLDGRDALWTSRTYPANLPDNLKITLDGVLYPYLEMRPTFTLIISKIWYNINNLQSICEIARY